MATRIQILTIDDHPYTQRLIEKLLRHRGYHILQAENGFSGIEIARKSCPDLILLDIRLPDINGFDVLRLLRLDYHTRLIPVIAVTTQADEKYREACLKAGFTEYIAKPVMRDALYTTVQMVLGSHRNA